MIRRIDFHAARCVKMQMMLMSMRKRREDERT